jgi:hypothetical protein
MLDRDGDPVQLRRASLRASFFCMVIKDEFGQNAATIGVLDHKARVSRQACSASLIRTTAEMLGLNSPNAWADGR